MCLRMGQPILIEDIGEQLSTLLEPLLTKQFTIVNNRKIVRLGDSDLEFDENFRMYFTTKLQNPHYLPEIFIRVTVTRSAFRRANIFFRFRFNFRRRFRHLSSTLSVTSGTLVGCR